MGILYPHPCSQESQLSWLGALFHKAEELELTHRFRASQGNAVDTFLQFIDDMIIFLI